MNKLLFALVAAIISMAIVMWKQCEDYSDYDTTVVVRQIDSLSTAHVTKYDNGMSLTSYTTEWEIYAKRVSDLQLIVVRQVSKPKLEVGDICIYVNKTLRIK